MLIYAALAWEEDLKPREAYNKARDVYKKHFVEMLTGISLSGIVSLLFFVPLLIMIGLLQSGIIAYSPALLIGFVVWFVLVRCLGMIVEQMFTAELYLWYKVYESAHEADPDGVTSIHDVDRPTFFDDVPDMLIRKPRGKDTQLDY